MLILGSDFSEYFRETQTAVTVGNFDGQHRGHRTLLRGVIDCARQNGLKSVFFSFLPHPAIALSGMNDYKLITSFEERRYYIEETGVDYFIEYPFSYEFSKTEPKAFLDMIFKGLNCKRLFIGEGYRFGRARSGKISDFKDYAGYCGVELVAIPHVEENGVKVSSSDIREMIRRKDFSAAAEAMLRPYSIIAGKEIIERVADGGFTIRVPEEKLLPPDGDYIVEIAASRGIISVDNKKRTAELKPGDFSDPGRPPFVIKFMDSKQ